MVPLPVNLSWRKGRPLQTLCRHDGVDIEVATEDVEEFIKAVELIAPSFGALTSKTLRRRKAIIEERLKESCDIPVMHDGQHGTAIIAAAGLLNNLQLGKKSARHSPGR